MRFGDGGGGGEGQKSEWGNFFLIGVGRGKEGGVCCVCD